MIDLFFNKNNCDRCHEELTVRTMSWFTNQTICMDCATKETELRDALRQSGDNTNYEGCGYVPSLPNASSRS